MATIYAKNKQTGEWERVGPAANATDFTLTLAGSPADAKATGEAIDNIQIRIENLTAEDVGALPSSTEIPSIEGLASEAYVNERLNERITEVVGGAPELLNTLDELSAALNDDENFATTVANQIATKQDKLTFDEAPTADSTNPVTSSGIKSYVDESIILKDTEIKLPASSRWLSICYGNGKFVAVGNNRKAAYSTDGVTWHETSMPSYEKWAKVVCGEDKFVALSFSNIAYSTDGITWSSVAAPSTTNSSHSWSDLAYGNGVFVITARSSTGSNPTSDYAYSTDGINWTKSNLPDALSYPHIAYGNGKFITCSGGVISSSKIFYSEDGINWSYMTYTSSINNCGISYVGDKFIIKTDSSGLENLYSTDGITWNTMSTGLNTTTYSPSYGYGNGMYVAVTSNSTTDRIQYNGTALYSTDGITWTQTTMPFKCSSDVAYGNGKFVALHNYSDSYDVSTDTIMYSDDGINWRSGISQLQTIGGENVTADIIGALKHTHPEYETGGDQADWNQNDETAPDYIKNKTHYSEFTEGIVKNYCLPEMTLTNGTIPVASAKLVANNQYIVECNGEIYNVTAQEAEVEGLMCVAVGNIGLMVDGNSTGEPFVFLQLPPEGVAMVGAEAIIANVSGASSLIISIYTEGWGRVQNIHHIDSKYIKDMYYETTLTNQTLVSEKTVSGFEVMQDPIYCATNPFAMTIVSGITYTVVWDGTTYECVAATNNSMTYIGNENYVNMQAGGDIPFAIIDANGRIFLATESTDASHTISVTGDITKLNKIDKKYLPETIVNIAYGSNGYKADLPFSEIYKVAMNNSAVFAVMDYMTYNLVYVGYSRLVFTCPYKSSSTSSSVYLYTLVINSDNSITTNSDTLQTSTNLSGKLLPTVYSSDDGKVLTVKNGTWQKVAPASGLPDVTTTDDGKVLSVVSGAWTATELSLDDYALAEHTHDDYALAEQLETKQDTISGTAGQFVVIGNDGKPITKTVPYAEEVAF